MHEYSVTATKELVGYAWASGNCANVKNGHKHEPHIDGTRACPGYPKQALYSMDHTSPLPPPVYNREMVRIDIDPQADLDDKIRSIFK